MNTNKKKNIVISLLILIFSCFLYATTIYAEEEKKEDINTEDSIEKVDKNKNDSLNYDETLFTLFNHLNKSSNDRVEELHYYEYLFKYRIPKNESIYFFKNAYKVLDVQGFEDKDGKYKALVMLEFDNEKTIYQWVNVEKQKDGYFLVSIEKDFKEFYEYKDSFDGEAIQYMIELMYDFNNLKKDAFVKKYFIEKEGIEMNHSEINSLYDEMKKLEFFSLYLDEPLETLKDDYIGKRFYIYDKNIPSLTGTPSFYIIKDAKGENYYTSFETDSDEYFDNVDDIVYALIGVFLGLPFIGLMLFVGYEVTNNTRSSTSSRNNNRYEEDDESSSIDDVLNNLQAKPLKKEDTISNILNDSKSETVDDNTHGNVTLVKESKNRNIVFDENSNIEKLKDVTNTKRSIHFDDEE